MIRQELYKQIFTSILLYRSSITADQVISDINDSIELYDLQTAYNDIISNDPNNKFQHLLFALKDPSIDETDVIPTIDNIRFETFTSTQIKNKRDFLYNTGHLTVFNSENLFSSNELIELSTLPDWVRIIEKICQIEENQETLFDIIENGDTNSYVLMFSNSYLPCESWNLYSYALLCYLNSNKIETDNRLSFSFSPSISVAIPYNSTTEYKQYFDIYDVLNEWQHADEVITSFLKMYHILEYIIYRKHVVRISDGATLKNSFIRQIKSLDKKNERDTFVKEYQHVFSGMSSHLNRTNIDGNTDVNQFISSYFENSINILSRTYTPPDKALANLIYDLRCSIVHNKESEFHITYTNLVDYHFMIPFIKNIIQIHSVKIIDIINDPNATIRFSSPSLTLYYQ